MHICFLSQEFPKKGASYGGIGTFLKTFSGQLISKGHQVTVIGLAKVPKETEEFIDGVRIITIPASETKYFAWRRNYKNIDRVILELHGRVSVDIIEGSELNFAFLNKHSKFKYVIRLHGGHHFFAEGENRKVEKWKGFQERKSFAKADGFIAVSDYVKSHTGKFLSFHQKPLEIINYPVPLDRFYTADPAKIVKGRLVFAGTVCEKKGIRQLIDALPLVMEKYPEVHLEAYGRDWKFPDGSSFIEFLKENISSDLGPKINFHGAVLHEDLPRYYEKAELCVFPSHMETQGLVAPEAMAMGKPVIFSKTGPGPETIDDGENGWLCDPFDSADIAEVIIRALDKREKLQSIGEQGQKKARLKFDPDKNTDQNLAFYSKILCGK
jgi:glycosyltransferase involved in cell wall biosynthesis